ncbi:MAG: sensor histidine kinase, partial [bacterium]
MVKNKERLTILYKQRKVHVEMQKEELRLQAENMMEVNRLLKESKDEILKQKDEYQLQNENMQEVNLLLREKQEEVQAQAEQLRKLNTTKDKLFSIIAHDLKNPFFAINNLARMINDQFDQLDDKQKKDLIGTLSEASGNAYDLMNKLLDWSRVQSSKLSYKAGKLELSKIIGEVIDLFLIQLK